MRRSVKRSGAVLSLLLAASAAQGATPAPDRSQQKKPDSPQVERSLCDPTSHPTIIDRLESVQTDHGTAGYVIDEPGHYVLANDLVVPNDLNVGILVTADEVSLSLRGHTIAERQGVATVIRGEGILSLAICDGRLEGGAEGIAVMGDSPSNLEIMGMQIVGEERNPAFNAIVADRIWTLRVEESRIVAADTGLRLIEVRHASIVRNTIKAKRVGVQRVRSGFVTQNVIEAPLALQADKCIIRGNVLAGAALLSAPIDGEECTVRLGDENIFDDNLVVAYNGVALCAFSSNFVANNRLLSPWRAIPKHLLRVESAGNLIADNRIGDAQESSIELSGDGNRLIGNVVFTDGVGVGVAGSSNLIENNVIKGKQAVCGVDFGSSSGNVHRNNTGKGATICGLPNLAIEAVSKALPLGAPAKPPRHGPKRPRNGPSGNGGVTLISELEYRQTSRGRVGLLIDAPGHYLLTRSLTAFDVEFAALITAPDVILDLGGHALKADLSGNVVEIVDARDVTIRNGVLDSGDGDGLFVVGSPGEPGSRLVLERMRVHSGGSCATAVNIESVSHVTISSSILGSNYGGVTIRGATTGRIADSIISATEHGLVTGGFNHGEIVRNILIGGHGDEAARILDGAGNLLSGNILSTRDENPLVMNSRNDVVANNTILGGVGSAVLVRGQGNRMDDNLIVGGICGIEFDGILHAYRRNVVLGVETGVCGQPAIDEGGNILPPWGCGDGLRDGDEVCDNHDLDASCQDVGFDGGILRCAATCDGYDASGCTTCGNGIREGGEQCEGTDLGGGTCTSLDFYSGTLSCSDTCSLDTSACAGRCGDGVLQAPELCDEWDFGGVTCASLGLGWGTLLCAPTCDMYDYTSCY